MPALRASGALGAGVRCGTVLAIEGEALRVRYDALTVDGKNGKGKVSHPSKEVVIDRAMRCRRRRRRRTSCPAILCVCAVRLKNNQAIVFYVLTSRPTSIYPLSAAIGCSDGALQFALIRYTHSGGAPIVELLLDRPLDQQCDTGATNYRGKTAFAFIHSQ